MEILIPSKILLVTIIMMGMGELKDLEGLEAIQIEWKMEEKGVKEKIGKYYKLKRKINLFFKSFT